MSTNITRISFTIREDEALSLDALKPYYESDDVSAQNIPRPLLARLAVRFMLANPHMVLGWYRRQDRLDEAETREWVNRQMYEDEPEYPITVERMSEERETDGNHTYECKRGPRTMLVAARTPRTARRLFINWLKFHGVQIDPAMESNGSTE